jgi:type I restriction enzyme S subunit
VKVIVPLPTPESWGRRRGKYLFQRIKRDPTTGEGVVTAFRDGQVTLRSKRREEGFTNAELEIGYQGIRVGDLVIHGMDGFAGAIGVSDSDGKASPVVHAYRSLAGNDPRFYAYLLRDLALNGFVASLAKGIRERSTSFDSEMFKCLDLPMPTVAEQKAIADYLDRETIRIDALIEKKKRMIELTELRRRQYWVEALDRLVKLTSRKIPLKYCAVEVQAQNKNGKETNRLSLSHGRVVAKDIESQDGLLPESFETYNIVRSGDVVLRLTDLQNDQRSLRVGHVQEAGIITSAYVALRPMRSIDPSFLTLVLRGMDARKDFYALGAGVRQSLKFDELGRLQIPVLSLDVQQEAVLAGSRIDDFSLALTRLLKDQIILLNEERQAIITAAVTTELKIPEVAA